VSIDILAELPSLYPVPDPTRSQEQANRFSHSDLEAEPDASLRRELSLLRWFNYFVDSEWHLERERRIAAEIRLRHERRGGRA
jgi:hypothetical protein